MNVIIRPIITEKSLTLAGIGQYTFEVDLRSNAIEIARAITSNYKVTVEDVRMANIDGKERLYRRGAGKTRRIKKAIVVLKKGEKIPGYEIEVEQHQHEEKPAEVKETKKAEKKTKESDNTESEAK